MKKVLSVLISSFIFFMIFSPLSVEASNEDDVLAQINAYRASAGLSAVSMDEDLQSIAAVRAEECAEKFSHTRPNGQAWHTVSPNTKGENLAHAVNYNQQKPENVVYAWILSPSHSANVLRTTFSSVGIAYYTSDSGETYIACEFK